MKDALSSVHTALVNRYLAAAEPPPADAPVDAPPTVTRQAPGELSAAVETVLGIAGWLGTAAGVAGVMITGTMMAVSMKRGESSEHFSRLGMVLGGCILVSTAGPVIEWFFNQQG